MKTACILLVGLAAIVHNLRNREHCYRTVNGQTYDIQTSPRWVSLGLPPGAAVTIWPPAPSERTNQEHTVTLSAHASPKEIIIILNFPLRPHFFDPATQTMRAGLIFKALPISEPIDDGKTTYRIYDFGTQIVNSHASP